MRKPWLLLAMGFGIVTLCVQPAVGKKIKLEVWSNGWPNLTAIEKAFRGFEKHNPNVTVNVTAMGTQWNMYPKLMLQVAAGSPPDLITVVTPIAELSDRNFLTPLNSYLKTSSLVKESDYNKAVLDIFKADGQLYAIPALDVGCWMALCYNQTMFAESGLNPDVPPRTLEELKIAHLKTTRIQDGRLLKLGFDPLGSMGAAYFPEMWCSVFGIPYFDKAKGRINFDTPEMARMMDYISFFKDGFQPKAYNDWRGKTGWGWGSTMAKGFEAMEIDGAWTPGFAKLANPKAKLGYSWFPNSKGDKLMVVGGWGLAIPKGAKHADLSWKLAEYITQKEAAQTIFDSVGFTNYNRRTLKQLDISKNPDVQWFLDAPDKADRVIPAPNIPMWNDIKSLITSAAWKVAQKQGEARNELKAVDKQAEVILSKYYKQVAKYKKK